MRASLITGCLMSVCMFAAALPASRSAVAADFGGEGYAEPPYGDGAYADDEGYDDEGAPSRYDRYGERGLSIRSLIRSRHGCADAVAQVRADRYFNALEEVTTMALREDGALILRTPASGSITFRRAE